MATLQQLRCYALQAARGVFTLAPGLHPNPGKRDFDRLYEPAAVYLVVSRKLGWFDPNPQCVFAVLGNAPVPAVMVYAGTPEQPNSRPLASMIVTRTRKQGTILLSAPSRTTISTWRFVSPGSIHSNLLLLFMK